jgi:RNA polymerase sigma-70 factor (ECF subfamily)
MIVISDLRTKLDAFEAETLPHKTVLFQSACSLLGSRAEAEDVVQETYLQAWKSFNSFEQGTNCRAWLFSILSFKIRHHRRKWTFRMKLTDDPNIFQRLVGIAREPIRDELTDPVILAALRKLPQKFAEVVLLADVHEFSYREVADAIGCPIGTVMSRLSRGRELLRGSLAGVATAHGIVRNVVIATA